MASHDAVMVVPGIMGSELIDAETGKQLWGLRSAEWYIHAWTTGRSLDTLAVTPDEREGKYGRIRPGRLLSFPAFAPILRGFEPYTRLVGALRRHSRQPDSVAAFAYDWRLPVAHNASLLADAAHQHLLAWRRLWAGDRAAARGDEELPRLIIVAHSMGGLLARHLSSLPGCDEWLRRVVTLGTPFHGSPKAALVLSGATGAPLPLPAERLSSVARTMPGMHDLLPTYRCVDEGTHARALTPADVAALGGDPDLARRSAQWHASLTGVIPAGHVGVAGTAQPTVQALSISGGEVTGQFYTCQPAPSGGSTAIARADLSGDGTVPRVSAQLPDQQFTPLSQTHGALGRCHEAVIIATDAWTDHRTGPWQGTQEVGIDLPDIVPAGHELAVGITGLEHPNDGGCTVTDVSSGQIVVVAALAFEDGAVTTRITLPGPGMYRVSVSAGGRAPVTEVVLATAP